MKCPYSFVLERPGGHDKWHRPEFQGLRWIKGIRIPCGKCLVCRRNRAREWAVRLQHELEFWPTACFVTLTYDDKYVPVLEDRQTLWAQDLIPFFKKLRRRLTSKIRYFACGEYGGLTSRPHYHAIIFGWRPEDVMLGTIKNRTKIFTCQLLADTWGMGNVTVGSVTDKSIFYVTGYLLKKLPKKAVGSRQKEFVRASQGMGLKYAEMHKEDVQEHRLKYNGHDIGVPLYYRKKLGQDKVAAARKRAALEIATKEAYKERGVLELRSMLKEIDKARYQSLQDLEAMLDRSSKHAEEI